MGESVNNETATGAVSPAPEPDQTVTGDHDMASPKSTKSPAFQFYPEAWFSSSKVRRMTHTERGMYIDLLAHCWLDNGLPTDVKLLAETLKVPAARFARVWSSSALSSCFVERGGKLHNARLDAERRKQAEHRKTRQEAANSRWKPNANALQTVCGDDDARIAHAMPSICISVSDSVSTKKEERSAEQDSSPQVLVFPVTGNPRQPTWALTEARIAGWTAAYPHVDVLGECRKALVWVEANAPKTAKGMPAFLVRWLNTAANRGGGRTLHLAATGTEGRGRTGAPPRGKYDGIEEQD